jgi:uncharacterized protein (TIGR02001 family)
MAIRLVAFRFTALLALASPAAAAEPAEGGVDLSANVGIVSDYRFRGLSLSDRKPALQGGMDLEAGMGLFAGSWASTIADYEGANVELDVYGGYAGSLAGINYRLSANAYFYPGGRGVDYMEFRLEAEREFGPVTLGAEAAFVPHQRNIGTANHYFGASASVVIPGVAGLAANARTGREQGFYDNKWDWELGLAYTRGALTASLAYVDSNYGGRNEEGRLGRAGLVASLLTTF